MPDMNYDILQEVMDMINSTDFIRYAASNKSLKEMANAYHYSSRQLSRLCYHLVGTSYKMLQETIRIAVISHMHNSGSSYSQIAERFFNGNQPQLHKYKKEHTPSNLIIQIRKREIGMKHPEQTYEDLRVLGLLAHSESNLTLKQLGTDRNVIIRLREQGYPIVSVPGRYHSGYNLDKSSRKICEDWINRIRINRFHLKPDFVI